MVKHQFYVISKIGTRYRGLAVVDHGQEFSSHHSFLPCTYTILDGMDRPYAIEMLLNTVELLQNHQNRICLEHEKRWAARFRECDWNTQKSANPFPFTMTCLVMGVTFKPSSRCYEIISGTPEPFNQEFDKCDNNVGISILDVTDLDKIRYCFVNINPDSEPNRSGRIGSHGAPSMIPLNANEFVGAYYHEEDYKEDWKKWIQDLNKLDVIDTQALNSVWPRNTWKIRVGEEVVLLSNADQGLPSLCLYNLTGILNFVTELENPLPINTSPLTLREASKQKLLSEFPKNSVKELTAVMDSGNLLPDLPPALELAILSTPAIITSSAAARHIFSQMLEAKKSIDLGPFDLSPEHIFEVLKLSKKAGVLKTLSLCGNQKIDDIFLVKLIHDFPSLESLYLLDTPQIPLAKKIQIFRDQQGLELFDSDLYALPFALRYHPFNTFSRSFAIDSNISESENSGWDTNEDQVPDGNIQEATALDIEQHQNETGYESDHGAKVTSTNDSSEGFQSFVNRAIGKFDGSLADRMPLICDVGYIKPAVEQMILIHCGRTDRNTVRDGEGGLEPLRLFLNDAGTNVSIIDGTGASTRYFAMPLKEVNRHPLDLMECLVRFMEISFQVRDWTYSRYPSDKMMARILAIGPADNASSPGYKVLPICAGLFNDNVLSSKHRAYQVTRQIIPNEWTLIVIAEEVVGDESYYFEMRSPSMRHIARYAFVSTADNPESSASTDVPPTLIVANAKQFSEICSADRGQGWLDDFSNWWEEETVRRWEEPLKFCGRKEVEAIIRSIKFTPVDENSNIDYKDTSQKEDKNFINCKNYSVIPDFLFEE
ncbi:hypothetical protein NHQ30_003961 [Ciborinia camelliae]|nr:hypothetical protein NHQ30_003961 [Ciborinia camelliae]